MKIDDNILLGIHSSLHECKDVCRNENSSTCIRGLSQKINKRPLVVNNSIKEDVIEAQVCKKRDIRSGRNYYEGWDKYASNAMKEIELEENTVHQEKGGKENKIDGNDRKKERKKPSLQERLLSIGKSKSMVERKWFAEREREKGNDLFKAKEYSASIDAYSMAIELYPNSALAHGNRAATNIKLKRWEDAIKDCDTAINIDGNYMKGYMRRGLANLEMDNAEESVRDLQKALEMDPNNHEIQTLIQRAKNLLKKVEEKREKEIEAERQKRNELDSLKEKEEMASFERVSTSCPSSNNRIQMIIEEVDEVEIDKNLIMDNNLQSSKSNAIHQNKQETFEADETNTSNEEKDKVGINNNNNSCLIESETNHEVCDLVNKSNIESNINVCKIMYEVTSNYSEENEQQERNLSWPNKYHKYNAQLKNLQSLKNDPISTSIDNENASNIEIQNFAPKKIENQVDSLVKLQVEDIDKTSNNEPKRSLDISNVEVPLKTIEVIETQQSNVSDQIGIESKRHESMLNATSNFNSNALAKEWRLSGNELFLEKKYNEAIESYTNSLTYQKSAATYSNRSMAQIKLKQFKKAEEDASHAISLDCKFYKAFYRRGMARHALCNTQGAKMDFEEVLKFTPNDKEIINLLTSMEVEYIPKRQGPMVIEEIEDEVFLETRVNMSSQVCNNKKSCANVQEKNEEDDCLNSFEDDNNNHISNLSSNQLNIKECNMMKTKEINPNHDVEKFSIDSISRQETKSKGTNDSNVLKPQIEIELEKRAQIEKDKGNVCFSKGQYTLAIECYTQSLEYVPPSAIVLANRALCYINLHEYRKALADSTLAIQHAPGYMKAFHRRAVASHKLGDLENALRDYEIVATFSQDDKKLNKDVELIKKEIELKASMNAKVPILIKQPLIPTSDSCEDDGFFMKPVRTTVYKNENKTSSSQEENINPNIGQNPTNASYKKSGEFNKSNKIEKKDDGHNNGFPNSNGYKKMKFAKIRALQKPFTALEFERTCNSLKEKHSLAREYINSIGIQTYPKLFKESFSGSILQCFIHILQKGFMPNDPLGAIVVLRGLTKVKRFLLALMVLQSKDKQGIDTLFYWLEFSNEVDMGEVQQLREAYHAS
ncbi:uncharacterized protein [Physcomitrium patens]